MVEPTQRFSDRVENYARYRPSYPPELVRLLESECGLGEGAKVADVGSGTGILSRLLLEHGAYVYGIEPNREMREAAERLLSGYEGFVSVDGTAEDTTLPNDSVDLVTAGQAFHWFDREAARREFGRILTPGGVVAIVWNSPLYEASAFMRDYRRILEEFGKDWERVTHLGIDKQTLIPSFAEGGLAARTLGNRQTLDLEALKGRLLSSSFVPGPDEPQSVPMLEELEKVFEARQSGGEVVFEYETRVFYGRLV